MKIQFDYWSTAKNRRRTVSIETASDNKQIVYLVYLDDSFEYMTDELIKLLWFVKNHYSVEDMNAVKKHFQ